MLKARKMRATEYTSHQEAMSAALTGRQFCVEEESGRVTQRLLTWSQACTLAEQGETVHA